MQDFDVAGLASRLRGEVRGEARFDAKARALYAADASNYRVPPAGVVLPRDVDDLITTVAVCAEFGAPITQRGAGTSVVGNAIGPGVVIDNSRYLNAIHEVDPTQAVSGVSSLEQDVDKVLARPRLQAVLVTCFAGAFHQAYWTLAYLRLTGPTREPVPSPDPL